MCPQVGSATGQEGKESTWHTNHKDKTYCRPFIEVEIPRRNVAGGGEGENDVSKNVSADVVFKCFSWSKMNGVDEIK